MNEVITLDENYSTTRRVIKVDQQNIADLVKQKNKPEHKFETVLFLPQSEGPQGEGGLRTKGFFKKSHNEKPLVTIITVVFNGENDIEETILSVINQTYENIEYIIIDGGSSDGTLNIIKKYENVLDYWISERDRGIYDAMNKGIDLVQGEWINFMNAGDLFYDNNVLSNIFSSDNQSFHMIYGNSCFYDEKNNYFINNKTNKLKINLNAINHQSVFINRNVHSPFSLEYKLSSDHNLIYKIFKIKKVRYINIFVCKYLIGGLSSNASLIRNEKFLISVRNGNFIDIVLAFVFYFYSSLKILIRFYILNFIPTNLSQKFVYIKNKIEGNLHV